MEKINNELKFKQNPRKISDRQLELLKAHLEELGDLSGVVYCRNNKAYVGGNQRSDVFNGSKITYWKQFKKANKQGTVAVGSIEYLGELYAYREVEFTPEQFKKACIVANNDGGEWDFDELAKWERNDLAEWGFDVGVFKADDMESVKRAYSKKIESPVYVPTMEKAPEVNSLYSMDKYTRLQKEIEQADISPDLKEFLTICAVRHIVYRYDLIAEFYAHQSAEVQTLMENSALVIVDFEKAIEKGFVVLTNELLEYTKNDDDDE